MKFLDFVFEEPAYNLACDEALLDLCEEGESGEVLRFWEPREHFIVLGYSGKVDSEVNLPFCEARRIPIFRRVSGGGTVLQGPGCLNYALVLSMTKHKSLGSLTESHRFILGRHKEILEPLLKQQVHILGQSDLVLDNLKFSGNAQRRKKRFLLYHGTFLTSLDLELMEKRFRILIVSRLTGNTDLIKNFLHTHPSQANRSRKPFGTAGVPNHRISHPP